MCSTSTCRTIRSRIENMVSVKIAEKQLEDCTKCMYRKPSPSKMKPFKFLEFLQKSETYKRARLKYVELFNGEKMNYGKEERCMCS